MDVLAHMAPVPPQTKRQLPHANPAGADHFPDHIPTQLGQVCGNCGGGLEFQPLTLIDSRLCRGSDGSVACTR